MMVMLMARHQMLLIRNLPKMISMELKATLQAGIERSMLSARQLQRAGSGGHGPRGVIPRCQRKMHVGAVLGSGWHVCMHKAHRSYPLHDLAISHEKVATIIQQTRSTVYT